MGLRGGYYLKNLSGVSHGFGTFNSVYFRFFLIGSFFSGFSRPDFDEFLLGVSFSLFLSHLFFRLLFPYNKEFFIEVFVVAVIIDPILSSIDGLVFKCHEKSFFCYNLGVSHFL